MEKVLFNPEVYELMEANAPVKSYKKTILGGVYVNYADPFTGEAKGTILRGDPSRVEDDKSTVIDLWSLAEVVYFKRNNVRHLDSGYLREYVRESLPTKKSPNDWSDEELEELLNTRGFMKLSHALNGMTSDAPVLRLLDMARRLEKTEKIISAITVRLSELQQVGNTNTEN
jgi:hypothetical protein